MASQPAERPVVTLVQKRPEGRRRHHRGKRAYSRRRRSRHQVGSVAWSFRPRPPRFVLDLCPAFSALSYQRHPYSSSTLFCNASLKGPDLRTSSIRPTRSLALNSKQSARPTLSLFINPRLSASCLAFSQGFPDVPSLDPMIISAGYSRLTSSVILHPASGHNAFIRSLASLVTLTPSARCMLEHRSMSTPRRRTTPSTLSRCRYPLACKSASRPQAQTRWIPEPHTTSALKRNSSEMAPVTVLSSESSDRILSFQPIPLDFSPGVKGIGGVSG